MDLYGDKQKSYYGFTRDDLISLIPKNPDNVILELGASSGNTLLKIKQMGLAKQVYGIELMRINNSPQTNPLIDKFLIGNIEGLETGFNENFFDVIIAGDVIEHLMNPWDTVKKYSAFLKKGGVFISSIPSIRERHILWDIIVKGDFKYVDAGPLDRTHIRFFCRINMESLFKNNGFEVSRAISSMDFYNGFSFAKIFNKITSGFFEEFFSMKYYIIAKKI